MKKLFFWAVISALLLAGCGRFLGPCFHYNSLSEDIREAEARGDDLYWDEATNQWLPNWCRDGYTEAYQAAVAAKETFIEKSDIAKFLSMSSETFTGSIVRLLIIIEAMLVFLFASLRHIQAIRLISKRVYRQIRRRNRRKKTVL